MNTLMAVAFPLLSTAALSRNSMALSGLTSRKGGKEAPDAHETDSKHLHRSRLDTWPTW